MCVCMCAAEKWSGGGRNGIGTVMIIFLIKTNVFDDQAKKIGASFLVTCIMIVSNEEEEPQERLISRAEGREKVDYLFIRCMY